MYKLLVLASFGALILVCQGVDYSPGDSLSFSIYDVYADKKCEKQGLMCKNCNTLVRCVEEDGGFSEYPVANCNATQGEFCWNDQKCSDNFNPECMAGSYEFKCTTSGMFPDPFNCKKYYICVKDNANKVYKYPKQCNGDWGYNMESTYCDIPMKSCPVDKLPCPQCKELGHTGYLENHSIWYICTQQGKNILPELHLCANGKWYNGDVCVDKNEWNPLPTQQPGMSTELSPAEKEIF